MKKSITFLLFEKYRQSGVEKIINITEVICKVLNLAKFSSATQVSSFAEDKVVMFGLIVTEESNFVDKFLYQISKNSFFLIRQNFFQKIVVFL